MQDIGPVFSEHAHKPDRINDRTQTVQSRNTPEQIVQLSAEVCTVICVHRDIRLAPVKLSRGIRPDIRTVFSKRLGYAQHDPSGAPAPCHVYLGYIHDATLSVSDPVNTIGAMIQRRHIAGDEKTGFVRDTKSKTKVEALRAAE